ncbi:melanoma antigen preferentially expressed in tumors-like [Canis lupus familiaris]|uniref:melanoma antigen preferentially expressed in tumors-like n=1 Tax=Canis lupus familiaris TaxID=9615 RepID=UPI0018F7DF34|nr:melanoma antigen preferentially expressed in tumors-like [Canis lupus familiaris]
MTACPELHLVRLVEMSGQDPLNLLDLAAQSLRNEKASAVRDLEELPVGLFPTLSTAAFDGGHTKTVTAMVQAWPFPCLRLGPLRDQSRTQDLLEAVLDGLELVPPNAVWPRRSKLKVLDFTHDVEHSQLGGVLGGYSCTLCHHSHARRAGGGQADTQLQRTALASPRTRGNTQRPFPRWFVRLLPPVWVPLVYTPESREEPWRSAPPLSDTGHCPSAIPQPCRDPGDAGAGDHPGAEASLQEYVLLPF